MYSRIALLVLISLAFSGCGRSQPAKVEKTGSGGTGERIKVGFVSNNAAEFWTIAEKGTEKAAEEFKVDVHFLRPPTGTAAEQKSMIDDLLTQDVKAIAISVNDPKNQRDYLNQIAEKVPLITQDNDAPDSKRLCYIGTDNYEAGKAVGKLVKEVMPKGGKIAIFVGRPDARNAIERRQGVLDEVAGEKDAKGPTQFGKFTLVGAPAFYDFVSIDKCKEQALDALTQLDPKKEDVCFIGLWQYNPPAIYEAVKQAGKLGQVKIVGFDEHDTTLMAIKDGHIHATVVQNPFEFGYLSVKVMTALAKGDKSVLPKGGILHVPHVVVNRATVEAFRKDLHEKMGKGN